jgi:two-component system, cell cycle sensor histidine kinase and response regulator CckA
VATIDAEAGPERACPERAEMETLRLALAESERVRIALEETNERYTQLADAIEEVAWLTDADRRAVLYVSPGYEKIWGRSCESLRQNPSDWVAAIHADDRARVQAARTRQGVGTYDEEYRIVRPDGTVRWIRDRAFPVRDASGAVIRVAGAAQDITKRRELEAQLNQSQKLESIGLLAGGIAHDFNNLLTVIGAGCHWLADALDGGTESREILDEVKEATERAASLTKQLLAFARREVTEARIVTIGSVVADCERMLRRILGEDILLTIDNAAKVSVDVDVAKVSQVLINLAVNARDAMPRGGALHISTSTLTIDALDQPPVLGMTPGEYASVTVSDTGCGMPEAVRLRVFEPFFTTKPAGRGTGLGLSVVHGIVTQSRGFIHLQSQSGVGTTFTIYLPALVAGTEVRGADSAVGSKKGSETVLLVEDDDAIRRVAKRALQGVGYRVLEAGDGKAAVEVAANHQGPIDLVVTDVIMPRMDGPALADRLCGARERRRVLFTSGYDERAIADHGCNGSQRLLRKPYDIESLRRTVRQVLDSATLTHAPPLTGGAVPGSAD